MRAARRRCRRASTAALLLFGLLYGGAAGAHPLGNNTVNRQAAISIGGSELTLHYLLDFAEIPTLVAMQDADRDHDGVSSGAEWEAYAEHWAAALPNELTLIADQGLLSLQLQKVRWRLRAGAADLQQLRMRAEYVAPLASSPTSHTRVHYTDRSRALDAGWRELWVTSAAGARIIATTAARADRSRRLTVFPSWLGDLPNETSTAIDVALNPALATAAHVGGPSERATAATVSAPAAGLWSLFRLGTHHIATGWDHLVFLLGLLLLSQSLRDLIKIVTAFTLAHSLTLGLSAAGLVTPPGSLVEPLIALTIAYVGLANLRFRAHAHGMPIAFGFGLIHGFGFAGALGATLRGHAVSGHSWLLDLAAFNLGIEVFQVALLVLVVSLLQRLRQVPWAAMAHRAAAFCVLGAGTSWFVLRVSGL